jgi:pilus assembly protein CpaF
MTGSGSSVGPFSDDEMPRLRRKLTAALLGEVANADGLADRETALVTQRLDERIASLSLSDAHRASLRRQVLDELVGCGPIQPLIDDPEISEIMVNRPNNIYVERDGRLEKTSVAFDDDAHIRRIIDRILVPLGRRVDRQHPTVEGRLPDGSRVHAVVPPVGLDGPTITIRKFRTDKLSMDALIQADSISPAMSEVLRGCVASRLNIVVSGGAGSGKTTLLNVLSGLIPATERIVTIEDAAELQLQHDNLVRLETKASEGDGDKVVTIRDLVSTALRMRPDRIVVGECRGGEALDMLQAMNTGHDGSLTTIHANTPRDAIARLETMVLMAGLDFPLKVVRQHICSAIDVIVQLSRQKDGSRKVIAITEVTGMEGEVVVMNEVFRFEPTGTDTDGKATGRFTPTGSRPSFSSRLEAAGFKLPPELFVPSALTDPLRRR